MLDFKFYGNGWKGNQWVTPNSLLKAGGNLISLGNAGFSFLQMYQSNTTLGKIEHGADGVISLVGMANVYTLAASLYYSNVMKNYPVIRQSINNQLIDRANMMQRGFIPVGHPGFPFK
jgi:hypothetical protein